MSPSEFRILIEELKNILKARRMTYHDLADLAGMSEAGIKRTFASKDGKISTLSKICEALGFTFIDLIASSKVNNRRVHFFTDEQDRFLADHFDTYIFFNEFVIRKRSLSEIKAQHSLSDALTERHLLRLEKIGILKRSRKGEIRFALRSPIGIKAEGRLRNKLQQKFVSGLMEIAFSSKAKKRSELNTREWTMSTKNIRRLKEDISKLIESYDQIAASDDRVLGSHEVETLSVSICLSEDSPYGSISKLN